MLWILPVSTALVNTVLEVFLCRKIVGEVVEEWWSKVVACRSFWTYTI
jgi:hypothetical protein